MTGPRKDVGEPYELTKGRRYFENLGVTYSQETVLNHLPRGLCSSPFLLTQARPHMAINFSALMARHSSLSEANDNFSCKK